MLKFGIEPYDEDRGTGFMRHAVVRVGHTSGEVLVTLVTNAREFPGAKGFCRELVRRCPFITTVVQNINERQTNVVLGQREQVLYGPGFILDELCGLSFRISSQSFYQVNSVQTEVLYRQAIKLANFTGAEHAIDAYCGTGTIAGGGVDGRGPGHGRGLRGVVHPRCAAERAPQRCGQRAVCGGRRRRVHVRHGRGSRGGRPRGRDENGRPLVLLMDPPRAGSSEEFLRAAVQLAPSRIVYISCNPETQVRDLAFLRQFGFEVHTVQPVDMFPHTDHIETVAVLTREKSVKSYAYVNISPSELGMGGKVKKPTYKQIQEYVLKNHGLKVSSLYIANLKDELGLDKQFSYEEAEMSAEKRPKCPPEKREAILDAFRHFGLIGEDETEK